MASGDDAARLPCSENGLGDGEYNPAPSFSSASSGGSSGFVASRVDFQCPDADVRRKTDHTQKAQWLVGVQRKAHEVYMQAAHSRTQLAKSRVQRLPIDDDDDDDDDDGGDAGDEAAHVSDLLDKLADCMAAASTASAASTQSKDWRQPGQLEAFLRRCLESWEAHNKILEAHAEMEKHMQKSRRAVENMQRRLLEAEKDSALLGWYAAQLKEGHDASAAATPATSPSSSAMGDILQEAREAAAKAAEAAQ